MSSLSERPNFSPELEPVRRAMAPVPLFTKQNLPTVRKEMGANGPDPIDIIKTSALSHREITIEGPNGDIVLLVVRSVETKESPRPAIYCKIVMLSKLTSIGLKRISFSYVFPRHL